MNYIYFLILLFDDYLILIANKIENVLWTELKTIKIFNQSYNF